MFGDDARVARAQRRASSDVSDLAFVKGIEYGSSVTSRPSHDEARGVPAQSGRRLWFYCHLIFRVVDAVSRGGGGLD